MNKYTMRAFTDDIFHVQLYGRDYTELFNSFPTVFSSGFEDFLSFSLNLKSLSANSFRLGLFKICRLGMA